MRYLLSFLSAGLLVACGAPYGAPVQQQRSGLYARPAEPVRRVQPVQRAPAPHVFAPPARSITIKRRPGQPALPQQSTGQGTGVIDIEASWYGERHHGKRTASGEPFDMFAMTAAHKTLRFGTRVRVIHPRTGQSVEVRINDRCARAGEIDLSKGAAEVIGLVREGRARVGMEILK